jgi:TPP-dependent 2-oxoacid decarboxylase
MAKYATGKHSKAISDRSGMEYPYSEMVKEWNGSFVHYTEFEPKQPQIRRRRITADAIALQSPRSQKFQQPTQEFLTDGDGTISDSGGASVGVANLSLPGDFAFITQGTSAMKPADPSLQNRRREMLSLIGQVEVSIS